MGLIRIPTSSDALQIAEVNVATHKKTYAEFSNKEILDALSVEDYAQRWKQRVEDLSHTDDKIMLLIEDEGAVAWYVIWGNPREEMEGYDTELYAIYIHPSHQGKWLWEQLFNEFQNLNQSKGRKNFYLWVVKENAPARVFYEKMWGKLIEEPTGEKSIELHGKSTLEVAYWFDI